MACLEEDHEFNCAYCMALNSIRVDRTGGGSQNFVVDCEVCCRPLEIEVEIDGDGEIFLTAKREGEG